MAVKGPIVLITALLLATRAALGGTESTAGGEEAFDLPSGLTAQLQEMLWDRPGGGLVYRFRFVAPDFTGVADFDTVMGDLAFLCAEFALPKLANTGPQPSQIIISLADKPSEFGVYNPDVTQVFEAYSVENGTCIWEVF